MQQRNFPSSGGLFAGGLILAISLVAQPGDPNSVIARDLLITFSAIFTAANAVGLLELRRQHDISHVVHKEPT